jgi:hypothetical protein
MSADQEGPVAPFGMKFPFSAPGVSAESKAVAPVPSLSPHRPSSPSSMVIWLNRAASIWVSVRA